MVSGYYTEKSFVFLRLVDSTSNRILVNVLKS